MPTARYRRDIDGLRAVAVAAVVLFHCGVPGFPGGYVGVDVFFVISGYLITGHLAEEIARTGRLSIAGFYVRRIRRIVPALVVVLALAWVAALFVLLPSYLANASRALAAAALSVANIFLWRSANYFATDSQVQPFLHTWSLSVEEQFYLVVPLLMAAGARWGGPRLVRDHSDRNRSECESPSQRLAEPFRADDSQRETALARGRWLPLFAPLFLLSFALSLFATTRAPTANFYLPLTRAWEMGFGSMLATTALPRINRRLPAEAAGALGLLLILLPVFLYTDDTPFPGLAALPPCLGAALLIHVGAGARPAATALLRTRPAVALGLVSYSLYLVHWPIIALVRFRTVQPLSAGAIAGVIAASLALSALSLRYVEQPFRRSRPTRTPIAVIGSGLAALAAVALLGLFGAGTGGLPQRFPNFTEQAIPGHEAWKSGQCFFEGNPDPRLWNPADCTRVATGPLRMLLWGDSFAAQYVPGLIAHADALGATLLQYTAAGCPPVLSYRSFARTGCTTFNAHALDVVRSQHIGLVILAGRWTDMRRRGLGELRTTLDALAAIPGLRVLLIGQSPEFATDVQVLGFLEGSHDPVAVNRWPVVFGPEINRQLATLAGAATFLDPMPVLCTGTQCTYQDHGTFLFEDYGHYSTAGSDRVVAAALLQALTDAHRQM